MQARVKLDDIIEGMELQSLEGAAVFDRRNGEIVLFSEAETMAAEDDDPIDDFPEWQQDLIRLAKEYMNQPYDFVELPSKFDVDERTMAREFCRSLDDGEKAEALSRLLDNSEGLARFRDAIQEFELANAWFFYRDKAIRQTAIDWCEDNNIPYDE